MYKLFAAILIVAACISPIAMGDGSANARAGNTIVGATSSDVNTLNPAVMDRYGYQIGLPLLAPNLGVWTELNAAAMPPRSYVAKSNPVLVRGLYGDLFVGESSLGIVAM